jgi:hypothetical protein
MRGGMDRTKMRVQAAEAEDRAAAEAEDRAAAVAARARGRIEAAADRAKAAARARGRIEAAADRAKAAATAADRVAQQQIYDFVATHGNEIDKLQDSNSPKWDGSWVNDNTVGDQDYGYTAINKYIEQNLDSLKRQIMKILDYQANALPNKNLFTNFTDSGYEIADLNALRNSRNNKKHSTTHSKTFGDIVVVMALHSSKIRYYLLDFPKDQNRLASIKSMFESRSMVIKGDKITFKYPMDNLKTLGDYPFSKGGVPANTAWLGHLKNLSHTAREFYIQSRFVYMEFITLINKFGFGREPYKQFCENTIPRFSFAMPKTQEIYAKQHSPGTTDREYGVALDWDESKQTGSSATIEHDRL